MGHIELRIGITSETETQLVQNVQACQAVLSINQAVDLGTIRIDQGARTVVIDHLPQVQRVDVFDLQGRTTIHAGATTRSTIDLAELRTGVYLFQLHTELGPVVKRFFLE